MERLIGCVDYSAFLCGGHLGAGDEMCSAIMRLADDVAFSLKNIKGAFYGGGVFFKNLRYFYLTDRLRGAVDQAHDGILGVGT